MTQQRFEEKRNPDLVEHANYERYIREAIKSVCQKKKNIVFDVYSFGHQPKKSALISCS
jgi:hypothetical protein